MAADPLTRVRRVTARRSRSQKDWHDAIRAAHASGASLRAIGDAAGISHVRVLKILRG